MITESLHPERISGDSTSSRDASARVESAGEKGQSGGETVNEVEARAETAKSAVLDRISRYRFRARARHYAALRRIVFAEGTLARLDSGWCGMSGSRLVSSRGRRIGTRRLINAGNSVRLPLVHISTKRVRAHVAHLLPCYNTSRVIFPRSRAPCSSLSLSPLRGPTKIARVSRPPPRESGNKYKATFFFGCRPISRSFQVSTSVKRRRYAAGALRYK